MVIPSVLSLQIGNMQASRVGLGTWALGGGTDWTQTSEQDAQETLYTALDQGINLIDTSPIYGAGVAEQRLGRALKGRRTQVLVASKCGISLIKGRPDHDLRSDSIVAECESSLKRLQTDYIDLYQIHWPDPKVPLAEALGTLLRLKEQGKIRAIGLCNVSKEQLTEALSIAPIVSVQARFSLLDEAVELAQFCQQRGVCFVAYGVLGGGILTAKYKQEPNFRRCDARRYFYKYYRAELFQKASRVAAAVKELSCQKKAYPSAVALAWALAQAGVSHVLVGARTAQQIQQNLQALTIRVTPTEEEFLRQYVN